MPHIKVGYGKANLSASVTSLASQRVTAPWIRQPAATSGRRTYGTMIQSNVGPHGDINGILYGETVDHDDGTIIMLTSSKARRGSPIADGAILLRLRSGAARLAVSALLPVAQDNYYGQRYLMFEGNADILSLDEAEVLGVRVPRGYAERFFDMVQVCELFDLIELSPATAARPALAAISTASGVVIKEVAAEPTRRIRIRSR